MLSSGSYFVSSASLPSEAVLLELGTIPGKLNVGAGSCLDGGDADDKDDEDDEDDEDESPSHMDIGSKVAMLEAGGVNVCRSQKSLGTSCVASPTDW